jgi:hypothetical protein
MSSLDDQVLSASDISSSLLTSPLVEIDGGVSSEIRISTAVAFEGSEEEAADLHSSDDDDASSNRKSPSMA